MSDTMLQISLLSQRLAGLTARARTQSQRIVCANLRHDDDCLLTAYQQRSALVPEHMRHLRSKIDILELWIRETEAASAS